MEKIEALYRATTSLASDLDLDVILPKALRILTEQLRCDNAAVLLPTRPGSRVLRIRAAVGYRPEIVKSLRLPFGKGITGWAMQTGEIVNLPDVTKDPRYMEGVTGAQAELAIPLECAGRRVGVLDLESGKKGAFRSREDVQILKIFAAHLATAVSNAERWNEVGLQNRNLELAAKIGLITTSTLNLAEMLDKSLALIRRELGCAHLSFFLLADEGATLALKAFSTQTSYEKDLRGWRQPADQGIVGAAVQAAKPMLVQDVSKDPRYLDVFPGTASELAVPVSFGGETIGVLNAESLRQGDFGRRQMKMMSSLGVTLAAAVRNSLLYGEIFEHSDRMSEAQAFARELNSTLDLRQILDVARDRLPNLVRARRIAIFRYDDEWLILDLVAHNFPGFSGRVQIAATDECDLTRALATNTSRNEVVPERQARGGQPHPAYPSGPFMSILLKVGERVVGVILFTERIASGPFTDQDFHFGNTVGEHLAVAIANSDLYEKTLRLSQTDGLTGLMVHRAFYEELDSRLVEAKMGERPLSLVMGDIDRFKSVNDRFGHPFGDRILSHVARVIREAIRPQDIAARYGGEEFVMILPDTDRRGAFAAAERIRTRLERESFRSSEGPLTVTISFGVAEFDPASDRTAFVESVDRALYRAKGNGRNRTEVFEAASPGE